MNLINLFFNKDLKMSKMKYSLGKAIRNSLIQSKLVRGFFYKTISYKSSHNVGGDFGKNLIYSNSPKINKGIVGRPPRVSSIEMFSLIGIKELISLLEEFTFKSNNKLDFNEYVRNLVFDYNTVTDLQGTFLEDLEKSNKFKGYGGLRTKVVLELIIEEFSKFYTVKLMVSVHYQFFLIVDAYENIKIDLSKNKDNLPDFEKILTKQTAFKIEKE